MTIVNTGKLKHNEGYKAILCSRNRYFFLSSSNSLLFWSAQEKERMTT